MGVQQQVPPSGESSSMNSPLHVSKVVGRMAILISPFPQLEDGNREKMEKEGGGIRPSSSPSHLGREAHTTSVLPPTRQGTQKLAIAKEVMS